MVKILAVIPVKLNSKRLRKKNLRLLDGYPLFLWTYATAIASKHIDKIIISTESKKVLNIAKKFGYKDSYQRPKKLIFNNTTNTDVVLDVIKYEKKKGYEYDFILLLQPTSPIRKKGSLDKFLKSYIRSKCNSAVSLKGPINKKYNFLGKIINGNRYKFLDYSLKNKEFFQPNGSIYISKIDEFMKFKKFFINPIFPIINDIYESIDIDYIKDLKIASMILKNKIVKIEKPKKLNTQWIKKRKKF